METFFLNPMAVSNSDKTEKSAPDSSNCTWCKKFIKGCPFNLPSNISSIKMSLSNSPISLSKYSWSSPSTSVKRLSKSGLISSVNLLTSTNSKVASFVSVSKIILVKFWPLFKGWVQTTPLILVAKDLCWCPLKIIFIES